MPSLGEPRATALSRGPGAPWPPGHPTGSFISWIRTLSALARSLVPPKSEMRKLRGGWGLHQGLPFHQAAWATSALGPSGLTLTGGPHAD